MCRKGSRTSSVTPVDFYIHRKRENRKFSEISFRKSKVYSPSEVNAKILRVFKQNSTVLSLKLRFWNFFRKCFIWKAVAEKSKFARAHTHTHTHTLNTKKRTKYAWILAKFEDTDYIIHRICAWNFCFSSIILIGFVRFLSWKVRTELHFSFIKTQKWSFLHPKLLTKMKIHVFD